MNSVATRFILTWSGFRANSFFCHFEARLAESLGQSFQFQRGFAGPGPGSFVAILALQRAIGQESLARPTDLFQQLFDHRFEIFMVNGVGFYRF